MSSWKTFSSTDQRTWPWQDYSYGRSCNLEP
jgi:hypothetical protein